MTKTKTPTVQEHLNETSEITRHLKQSDALVVKLRDELKLCREAFGEAERFSHPDFKLNINGGYYLLPKGCENSPGSLKTITDYRIAAINELLGDRA